MATLSARKIEESGLAGSLTTCTSGGDEFLNTGIEFIRIQNDHASQLYTVTVTAQTTAIRHATYGSLTKSNTSVSVAAGGCAYIGPFKQNAWNDSNEKVQLTYIAGSSGSTAISTVSSGDHKLKVELLYLDNQ